MLAGARQKKLHLNSHLLSLSISLWLAPAEQPYRYHELVTEAVDKQQLSPVG